MNPNRVLAVDALIAVVIAALVLILAPGLAIVAIFALIVLIAGTVSLVVRHRRGRQVGRRSPPPQPTRSPPAQRRPPRIS